MRTVSLSKRLVDFKAFIKRFATPGDATTFINEPCRFQEDGVTKIVYDVLPWDTSDIVGALRNVKFVTALRTGGLKSTSRTFGYLPRVVKRRDFCTISSMARQHAREHEMICQYASRASEIYRREFPELYGAHDRIVKSKVLPQYLIESTPFTSGIANCDNQLRYHFDAGNFKGANSVMLAFKNSTGGGWLAIPEYDIALEIANNSITIFDGQSIMHGVTPINHHGADSYRFTIVYYSLQQMWSCRPLNEELARIRQVKTQREVKRSRQ